MTRRRAWWALGLAVALSGGVAWAFCRTTTSRSRSTQIGVCNTNGVPLAWRNACTGYSLYRFDVPDGIAMADLDRIAAESAGAWGRVACDDNGREPQYYRVIPLGTTTNPSGYVPAGANSNTVSFRHRWGDDSLHRTGAIAITIVTFDSLTGEIFDADIELNTFDEARNPMGFTFSTTRLTDPTGADLQTILTHELGHFIGLAHSDNDRAVMWPEAGLGETRRDLTSDDAAGVCTIYPQARTPPYRGTCLPYGGLALNAGGAKIQGSCAVTPGATSGGALGLAAGALAAAVARRRRRA